MAFDGNDLDDVLNTRVRDSFNTTNTSTTTTVGVDLDNVGNTETNELAVDNSGNVDSHDVAVSDSWNETNTEIDLSDNSINDSGNSIEITDASVDDHSINAGVREYNTGSWGAGSGVGGGNATIVDQSVNGNILAGGDVAIGSANVANVASGVGSIAVGGDFTQTTEIDRSVNYDADGDINIGNHTELTSVVGSFNTANIEVTDIDNSWDVDVDGSFNDESVDVALNDSFNELSVDTDETTWTIDADVIWGSDNSAILSELHVNDDLPEA